MKYQIEICANSVQSVVNAQKGGAHRVELCDNLWEGGTTPSMATIQISKEQVKIPVFVLIRPRGGDFAYTDLEFETMKRDIFLAKEAGADGVVSGVLTTDGELDYDRVSELVELSKPLPFTFHRAFDLVNDPFKTMDELVELKVSKILSSGLHENALLGLRKLKELKSYANGRITIMPGGGLSKLNVRSFFNSGFTELHLSAKQYVSSGAGFSPRVPMNGSKEIPEDRHIVSSVEIIENVIKELDAVS